MNETKTAYIFVGQSGAGKGTQIQLLISALAKKNSLTTMFHVETGERFREFIQNTTYTAARTHEYMERGILPPSFLGIYMWSRTFVEGYNGEEVVLVDGTPRIIEEVPILLSACAFYELHPVVVNIIVGDTWAYEKTKNRGRSDDTNEAELKGRIEWFHTRVEPVISQFAKEPHVTKYDINGEQTIEAVHADVCKALGLV